MISSTTGGSFAVLEFSLWQPENPTAIKTTAKLAEFLSSAKWVPSSTHLLPYYREGAWTLEKWTPNKIAGCKRVSLLGEKPVADVSHIMQGAGGSRWRQGQQGPQSCSEPSSSNPPGLLACHRAHSDLPSACCQEDGSPNRTLAGGKMRTAFSLCKGCSFREQQTACKEPLENRAEQIWQGKNLGTQVWNNSFFF